MTGTGAPEDRGTVPKTDAADEPVLRRRAEASPPDQGVAGFKPEVPQIGSGPADPERTDPGSEQPIASATPAPAGPMPPSARVLVLADPDKNDDHGAARDPGRAIAAQLGRSELESVSDDHTSRHGRFDSDIVLGMWGGILLLGGMLLRHLFSSKSY